ncbi:MAG: hypothetical protein FD126_2001 [Elusimicrobia bacterium]|nr:MAG: hypothetical protein FD126_2001 [Elusimicrobiota bacterium]
MRNLIALAVLLAPLTASAARPDRPNKDEEEAFNSASQLYGDTARDKAASIEAFERFLQRFPDSARAADAQFMVGEGSMDMALKILKNEADSKKTTTARLLAPKNTAAIQALQQAEQAFQKVLDRHRKADGGLRSSAQYRVGEAAYNAKDWGRAIEEWRTIEKSFSKSYLVPESWMGIIFANLALEQFSQAEANLFLLGETYPNYLKVPEVLYVQGIISLHKGDYGNAEKALALVKSAEAQFYLGKTYLLSKRPYLAAAAFRPSSASARPTSSRQTTSRPARTSNPSSTATPATSSRLWPNTSSPSPTSSPSSTATPSSPTPRSSRSTPRPSASPRWPTTSWPGPRCRSRITPRPPRPAATSSRSTRRIRWRRTSIS